MEAGICMLMKSGVGLRKNDYLCVCKNATIV